MSELKVMLWTGGDAPDRDATLLIGEYREIRGFYAYYEPGYCGCEDCHPIVGGGDTPDEARTDYWEQWTAKYAPEAT